MGRLCTLAALIFSLAGAAQAAPVDLTASQIRQIERMNRDVNGSMPLRRADGAGNCIAVAEAKFVRLGEMGVPLYARHTVIVRSPGWGSPLHEMVVIETTRGPLFLDMNSPWLETATQVLRMGYRPYATDWRTIFAH